MITSLSIGVLTRGLPPRIAAKIKVMPSGCWEWTAARNPQTGYGVLRHNKTFWLAHRATYTFLVGPIPEGLDIDHLCRNRACVKPTHLEPVTRRENLMRGKTLAAAHHAGQDCGFPKCRSCERHRSAS